MVFDSSHDLDAELYQRRPPYTMMSFDLLHALLCFQANRIVEHRRKYERKREEKEIKERQERVKKAREEHARAQRVSCSQTFPSISEVPAGPTY